MAIELNPITSGYSTGLINDNFQFVEDELNNNVLRRDGLSSGEANNMEVGLDMNSNFVYNLPEPVLAHQAARLQDVQNAINGADSANLISFTPYGNISAENVQGAIQELSDGTGQAVTSSTGNQSLKDSLDDRVIDVSSVTELKALDPSDLSSEKAARVATTGRAGDFVWRTGDQSANVTADPQEGVWAAPDSDATGASGAWERTFSGPVETPWFGSLDDTASTTGIQAAIDSSYDSVLIPAEHTPQAVGLTLKNDLTLIIDGVLSLPDSSPDLSNIITDSNKTGVTIRGKGWLDGNRANQGAGFVQQIISLNNCDEFTLEDINYRHNHIESGNTAANTTGAVKISNSRYVKVNNVLAYQGGHEQLWLELCDDSKVDNFTAIGEAGWSWSGLQFSGKRNRASNIYSENAGASGISFDCRDSIATNLVSIGTRFQNGMGFGEAFPAHNTSVYGAYSEGAGQSAGEGDEHGIKVQKSHNFWLFGAQSKNPTAAGISITNNASRVHLVGCRSYNAGSVGLQYADCEVFIDDGYFPEGVQRIDNGEKSVVGGAWEWLASSSGTNEFYLTSAGTVHQPGILEPHDVTEDNTSMTRGTTGSLAAGEWNWGDNDDLGYKTVYVRLSDGADPDSKANGFVKVESTPNINSNNLILSDRFKLIAAASIANLAAGSTTTVSNSNIHRNSQIAIFPSTEQGAGAQAWIDSIQDGSVTFGVTNATAGAAFLRYSLS